MTRPADPGVVTATIPAAPKCIHILRTVVASVASRISMSIDDVDDLRLAVDEAAARLLVHADAGLLLMTVALEPEGLAVVVSVDAQGVSWPDPDVEETLPWKILTSLTQRVSFQTLGGRPAIRMFKPLAGHEVLV